MQIKRDTLLAGVNLNEYLPHNWIIDDIVVNKDLSTSIGFCAELPPYYTFSDDDQNAMHSVLSGFLNSLPPTVSLQILWEVTHSVGDLNSKITEARDAIYHRSEERYKKYAEDALAAWEAENNRKARTGAPSDPMPELAPYEASPTDKLAYRYLEETSNKWNRFAEVGCLRRYRIYFTFTSAPFLDKKARVARAKQQSSTPLYPEYSAKGFLASLWSLFSEPEMSDSYTQEEWDNIVDFWRPIVDSFSATMESLRFRGRRMREQDIVNLLFRMWSPATYETAGAPDVNGSNLSTLPELYLSDSVSVNRKTGTFYTDGKAHKILSLEVPASTLIVNIFATILEEQNVPNLHVVLNILPYDRVKRVAELQKELPMLRSRVVKDPKLAVAVNQIQAEIYNLQQTQEVCWRAAVYFHTWADDDKTVEMYAAELKRLGRLCNNSNIVSESIAAWRYWVAMMPFWGRDTDLYRHFHISTLQLCCLIPLTGHTERLQNEPLSMLLETANASVFNYNPMDNMRLNNYNTLICGGSGTGKSFLAGSILLNMLMQDARVVCIDIGASYASLCEAFGGEYITMDAASKSQTLNPLARSRISSGNPAADRANVIRWLEVALLDDHGSFGKDIQSDLDNALSQLYGKFSNSIGGLEPTLSDLRQLLVNYESAEMRNLAKRLELYCTGGQFGALFDGQTKIDLNNPFIVFDLTQVKDHPDLGPLTLMSVMSNVQQMAANYPKQAKMLLLDEAWALLNTEAGAKFVIEAYRTYRKLNVGILGISQEVADWTGGHLRGIISNVSTYFILTQANSGTLESAAEIVGFNPREVAIAGNLHKEKGKYSQALLVQKCQTGKFSTVIVNRTTPLQYALMTTDGRDRAVIRQIMEENQCSNLEARMIFAEKYPHGA